MLNLVVQNISTDDDSVVVTMSNGEVAIVAPGQELEVTLDHKKICLLKSADHETPKHNPVVIPDREAYLKSLLDMLAFPENYPDSGDGPFEAWANAIAEQYKASLK